MNPREDDSGDAPVRAPLIAQPPSPIGCGLAGGRRCSDAVVGVPPGDRSTGKLGEGVVAKRAEALCLGIEGRSMRRKGEPVADEQSKGLGQSSFCSIRSAVRFWRSNRAPKR